jgi:hypothetical protein
VRARWTSVKCHKAESGPVVSLPRRCRRTPSCSISTATDSQRSPDGASAPFRPAEYVRDRETRVLRSVNPRWGSPLRRAALCATAASITWALMAAFMKATTNVLAASGPVSVLEHWPIYALIASGVLGSVLQQAALQVGPVERVPTADRRRRPCRRHRIERLGLRRAIHDEPGPEDHRGTGLLRHGLGGYRLVADGAH